MDHERSAQSPKSEAICETKRTTTGADWAPNPRIATKRAPQLCWIESLTGQTRPGNISASECGLAKCAGFALAANKLFYVM